MSELTEAFIEEAWGRQQEPLAQLVTITSDADPEPIRATDWAAGIVSQGDDFPHFPFRLAWAGASKENPFGEGRLTIANVDRRIEDACDAAIDPPEVSLSLVRVSAPDSPEVAISGARIPSVEGDASQVSAIIRPRSFKQEPACAFSYTPATAPGLF